MKKITLVFSCLLLAGILSVKAQSISVVASGLTGPIGLCKDTHGNLLVAEVGTGNNDGKISMINSAGVVQTIIYGLPSFMDTTTHETTGPWRPYITADSMLWVINGGGVDSNAGSIMVFDVSGVTPGMDSLTVIDAVKIINVQSWALANGFVESDLFSAVWDSSGNIYAVDAAANAVFKIDTGGNFSIVDTFPAIPNTFTPFPPMIDYVPTKIISDNSGGFYMCNLTGFPFLPGLAEVVSIDTAGTVATAFTGLSQAVDMEVDTSGTLYVLQFGLYDTSFVPVPNSASIVRLKPGQAIDTIATGFGPSAGMIPDSSDGFYVTELMTGRVLHIENPTIGISQVPENLNALSVYPNPFSNLLNVEYTLKNSSPVTYSITDQTGKRIYIKNEGLVASGEHHIALDLESVNISSLAKGIYFFTVTAGETKQTISILKK